MDKMIHEYVSEKVLTHMAPHTDPHTLMQAACAPDRVSECCGRLTSRPCAFKHTIVYR